MTNPNQSPLSVLERSHIAMNQHDLEAFLECIDPDYHSEQPVHPDRQFTGKDQVYKNWSNIFSSIPDFHAELLRVACDDNTVWAEWDWQGTRSDDTLFHMRGTTIFEVRNDRIISGRLYIEPVERGGAGIDANIKTITTGDMSG